MLWEKVVTTVLGKVMQGLLLGILGEGGKERRGIRHEKITAVCGGSRS